MNIFIIILILVILSGFACREEPTKPPIAEFTLTAEDIGVTDIFFRVKATLSHGPFTLYVKRDGQQIYQSQPTNLTTVDTLLYDDNLLPKQNYTYKAYYTIGGIVQDSSAPMIITTMDTTSHDFSWKITYLGDGSSSMLYDVAIINDTLAYAVGEIYLRDSLGNWDPLPYNIVKWDGQQWELKRVTVIFRGNLITPPIYCVYALSSTDIWFAAGMAIHGNGTNWVGYDVRAITGYDTLSFTKCWGQNSSDIYFVGLRGSLAHYSNGTWRRIETLTTLPINDIYGAENSTSGKWEILAVASNKYQMEGKKLLRIEGLNCNSFSDSGLSWSLSGLWFDPGRRYYVVGAGIHKKRSLDKDGVWQVYPSGVITSYYSHAIRGNGIDDVWVGGSFGEIVHFNGYSWHNYTNELASPMVNILSIAVKNNLVVAVGDESPKAVVIMGRRKM